MFFIANIKKVKKKKNHWRMQVEDELFEVEGWSQNYGPARCVGREEEFLSTCHLVSAESRLCLAQSSQMVPFVRQNNHEFEAGVGCET